MCNCIEWGVLAYPCHHSITNTEVVATLSLTRVIKMSKYTFWHPILSHQEKIEEEDSKDLSSQCLGAEAGAFVLYDEHLEKMSCASSAGAAERFLETNGWSG